MLNNHGVLDWQKNDLWNGCILASIACAIFVAQYPGAAYAHSWDKFNYCIRSAQGSVGVVSFRGKYCVGAFRDSKIDSAHARGFMPAIEYLWNAPVDVIAIAESENFQYLLDLVNGTPQPVITTAFWGDDKGFHINDTYEDFMRYGGYLLERQTMNFEQAIEEWRNTYAMTIEQVDLLKSIYTRKIANPEERILLTKEEIAMIDSDDPEGLEESKISFEELNIYWEE